MILEIIPEGGVGAAPIVLRCQQVIVRTDDGTPIGAFAVFGQSGSYTASIAALCDHCKKPLKDFNRTLSQLGVHQTVMITPLHTAPPPRGAILAGRPKE